MATRVSTLPMYVFLFFYFLLFIPNPMYQYHYPAPSITTHPILIQVSGVPQTKVRFARVCGREAERESITTSGSDHPSSRKVSKCLDRGFLYQCASPQHWATFLSRRVRIRFVEDVVCFMRNEWCIMCNHSYPSKWGVRRESPYLHSPNKLK